MSEPVMHNKRTVVYLLVAGIGLLGLILVALTGRRSTSVGKAVHSSLTATTDANAAVGGLSPLDQGHPNSNQPGPDSPDSASEVNSFIESARLPISTLPLSELDKALELLISEFSAGLELRTISAEVRVKFGIPQPGTDELWFPPEQQVAGLKAEVIPLTVKTGNHCVKIRIRLDAEIRGRRVALVKDDIYDEHGAPFAWPETGEELSRSEQDDLLDIYRAIPWEYIFMTVDNSHDDFQAFRDSGIRTANEIASLGDGGIKWTPIRASGAKEEKEFFGGKRQYLLYFYPGELHEFWFDAATGEFSMFRTSASAPMPRRVQFGQYVSADVGKARFASRVSMHWQKDTKRFQTDVDFVNLSINKEIREDVFLLPRNSGPLK